MAVDRQRIDKWLWHARVVRTRTTAAALVSTGHVRVNAVRVTAPSHPVRAGDILTISLDSIVRILRVTAFADKRGGAPDAAGLWEDLTPPPPEQDGADRSPAERDPGSGRPTKRERRALDRLRDPES